MTNRRRQNWIRVRASSEGLEWAEAYFTGYAFSPHRHDTYAIGYTTMGLQAFNYRGEAQLSGPGNVFVLHPDELHDGRPGTEEGYGYRIVYISPALISRATDSAVLPFVADAVSSAPRLMAVVAGTFPDSDEPKDELHQTDAVAALADARCEASGVPGKATTSVDLASMRRVRDHLLASTIGGVRMSVLEREHGMDRYSLSRHFRRTFGVSPQRFIKMRRLDLMKSYIRDGLTLAEAAIASGFADQSHMTRHFRDAFGLSPGAWRKLALGSRKFGS